MAFVRHSLEITLAPAPPGRPVDPQFNDAFWREFVYNSDPGAGFMRSRVLPAPATVNVYLRTDPWPPADADFARDVWIPRIRDQLGSLVRQLTGATWGGHFETGPERANQNGWITIRFVDPATEPDLAGRGCGWASLGALAGRISINMAGQRSTLDLPAPACFYPDFFPYLLAHEFGHAFGFYHVSDVRAVMGGGHDYELGRSGRATFTPTEQYHARLAYEAGRNKPYCGWPFSSSCLSRGGDGVRPALLRAPRIVVD